MATVRQQTQQYEKMVADIAQANAKRLFKSEGKVNNKVRAKLVYTLISDTVALATLDAAIPDTVQVHVEKMEIIKEAMTEAGFVAF